MFVLGAMECTLKDKSVEKCIGKGLTLLQIVFWEGKSSVYGRKLRFTAPPTGRRKTKFATIKPTIYLSK